LLAIAAKTVPETFAPYMSFCGSEITTIQEYIGSSAGK